MVNGYEESLTIDRVDSNGDYSPDNCRWADNITQRRNRSSVMLNFQIAQLMRRLRQDGMKVVELAEVWGVSAGVVSAVMTGRNWPDAVG